MHSGFFLLTIPSFFMSSSRPGALLRIYTMHLMCIRRWTMTPLFARYDGCRNGAQ